MGNNMIIECDGQLLCSDGRLMEHCHGQLSILRLSTSVTALPAANLLLNSQAWSELRPIRESRYRKRREQGFGSYSIFGN